MKITLESGGDLAILSLAGEFDATSCPLLRSEIEGLIAAGDRRVVLNLRRLKFIDSSAIGAMIEAMGELVASGGGLVISHPSKFCRDVFERLGLDQVLSIHATDEAAGKALPGLPVDPPPLEEERE